MEILKEKISLFLRLLTKCCSRVVALLYLSSLTFHCCFSSSLYEAGGGWCKGINIITAYVKNEWHYEFNEVPLYPISILNKPNAFIKTPIILVMHNSIEIFKNKSSRQICNRQKTLDLLQIVSL